LTRPQAGAELVARHDLAGVLHQQFEHATRLFRDGNEDAAPAQFARPEIQFELGESGSSLAAGVHNG
jgi:hypothetical protein